MVEAPRFTVVEPPRPLHRRRAFLLPFGASTALALTGVVLLVALGAVTLPFRDPVRVTALMASKAEFFADAQVRRILMARGVQVELTDSQGSLNIARSAAQYDLAVPSGHAVGNLVREATNGRPHSPWASHLVVVAFRDYADALVAAGAAEVRSPAPGETAQYYTLKMDAFVALGDPARPRRWSEFGVPSGNVVLADSPDPCFSYSGAAFVGMTAFAAAAGAKPADRPPAAADTPAVVERIRPMWEAAGQAEARLGQNFFGPEGRSISPVAVVYEHYYFRYQIEHKQRTGDVDRDRVLLYPDTHHDTQPMLVAVTDAGERVARLVESDPELRRRALELGFRLTAPGSESLEDLVAGLGIERPPQVGQGTEAVLPSREVLLDTIAGVRGCRIQEVPG